MTLKELRSRAGMSQAALAKQLGVSCITVSHWERHLSGANPDNLAAMTVLFGDAPDDVEEIFAGRPKHSISYYQGCHYAGDDGHTLRDLRLDRQLTQDQMAAQLKVSRVTYNRWETLKQCSISEAYEERIRLVFGEIPSGISFTPYGKDKLKERIIHPVGRPKKNPEDSGPFIPLSRRQLTKYGYPSNYNPKIHYIVNDLTLEEEQEIVDAYTRQHEYD